jgi:GTP-binding protein EngB required for normal cell division
MTKIDKLSRSQAGVRRNAIIKSLGIQPLSDPVLFSAKTGEGKEKIWNVIKNIVT